MKIIFLVISVCDSLRLNEIMREKKKIRKLKIIKEKEKTFYSTNESLKLSRKTGLGMQ